MRHLFLLFALIINFTHSQNINGLQPNYTYNAVFQKILVFENYILTLPDKISGINPQTFLIFDPNLSKATVRNFPTYLQSFEIYNQLLFVNSEFNTFYSIPIYSFLASNNFKNTSYSALYSINEMKINDPFLIIQTGNQIEKWDLKNMTRLEFQPINSYLLLTQGSSYFTCEFENIVERSIYNLSRIISIYANHSQPIQQINIDSGSLFSASKDYTVKQWSLSSKQLVRTFIGHTYWVQTVAISGNFMFSGSVDHYWIQWFIDSGQIYRKVAVDMDVEHLLLNGTKLYVASLSYFYMFNIPEIVINPPFLSATANLKGQVQVSTVAVSFVNQMTQLVSSVIQPESSVIHSAPNSLFTNFAVATSTDQLDFKTNLANNTHTSSSNQKSFLFGSAIELSYMSLMIIIIFSVSVSLLFFTGILIYFRVVRKKKPKTLTTETTSSESTTANYNTESITTTSSQFPTSSHTSSSISSEMTSTAISSQFNDMTTMMVTQNAYAIPGFLETKATDFRVLQKLTKGGQAEILIAEVVSSEMIEQYKTKNVILKSNNSSFEHLTKRQQNLFYQELAMIYYFREKPGFVRVYGYTLEPAALIMQNYPLGNLERLISKKTPFQTFIFSKRFILGFYKLLTLTIFYLHDAGFVHCDLKPQNILLEDQKKRLVPILTDFGISQIVHEKVLKIKAMTIEQLKGFSVDYAAPEQIKEVRERKWAGKRPEIVMRRDIYALAGILFSLLNQKLGWSNK